MISTCHQKAILSMIRNDCSNCTPKIIPDAHIMHAIEILNACFRLNHSHLSDSSFHFVCLCMRCVPPPSSSPHTPTHTHSSIPRNSILTFINEKKKKIIRHDHYYHDSIDHFSSVFGQSYGELYHDEMIVINISFIELRIVYSAYCSFFIIIIITIHNVNVLI